MERRYKKQVDVIENKISNIAYNDEEKYYKDYSSKLINEYDEWNNMRLLNKNNYNILNKDDKSLRLEYDILVSLITLQNKRNKNYEENIKENNNQNYSLEKQINGLKEENRLLRSQYSELKHSIDKASNLVIDKTNIENNYKLLLNNYNILNHKIQSINKIKQDNEKELNSKIQVLFIIYIIEKY